MDFDYIRERYKVPAEVGRRVFYKGQLGIITSARGCYIRVRLDGEKRSDIYHPTWEMVYLEPVPHRGRVPREGI
jgi:hypothetical protein